MGKKKSSPSPSYCPIMGGGIWVAAQPKPSFGFFSQEAAAALNILTVVLSIFHHSALWHGVALRILRFGAEAEFVPYAECFCNYKYINVYRNGVAEPHHKPTQMLPTRTTVVISYMYFMAFNFMYQLFLFYIVVALFWDNLYHSVFYG